jgi:hypothetical protein
MIFIRSILFLRLIFSTDVTEKDEKKEQNDQISEQNAQISVQNTTLSDNRDQYNKDNQDDNHQYPLSGLTFAVIESFFSPDL